MIRLVILVLALSAGLARSWMPQTVRFCVNNQENGFEGYCIHFVRAAVDFVNAEETCAQFGGHLAHITNPASNQFILESARKAFGDSTFWIGATRDFIFGGNRQWHWTNKDVPFSYNNGLPQQNGTVAPGNCAQMDVNGRWLVAPCCDPYPFVCATAYQSMCGTTSTSTTVTIEPISNKTPASPTPTSTTPSTSTHCPPCPDTEHHLSFCDLGWTLFPATRSCYRVYHNMDWPAAEETCACENAHLASIHSDAENRFVVNLTMSGLKGDYEAQVWIGATSVNKDANYAWSDNTPWNFTNWKVNEPNNLGRESCVQLLADPCIHCTPGYEEGKWNNKECSLKTRAFICKKPASYPEPQ